MATWPIGWTIGVRAQGWLDRVVSDDAVGTPVVATAYVLARHCRESGKSAGLCWPSHETIRNLTNNSERTTKAHIAALIARGHLEIDRSGGRKHTRYRLVLTNVEQPKTAPRTDRKGDFEGQFSVGEKQSRGAVQRHSRGSLASVRGAEFCNSEAAISSDERLKRKGKTAFEGQFSVAEHTKRTYEGTTARGAALPAPAPLAVKQGEDVSEILDDHESESFTDTLARALGGDDEPPDEPHDFDSLIFSDDDLARLDPGPDDDGDRSAFDVLDQTNQTESPTTPPASRRRASPR